MLIHHHCRTCNADCTIPDGRERRCPNCGSIEGSRIATATARVIECPTYYVEYRGWSQEVNTLHVETLAEGDDESKRFSADFKHTPLDTKYSTVHGHSPSDVLAKVKHAIESAPWQEHYRQIIDRLNKAEAIKAPLPPPASPADAPSPPATA